MPIPTPIATVAAATSSDFLGIPAWLWVLLVLVIIVQGLAFARGRWRKS